MEDGHTLFDYDVGLNDIVQLMIRPKLSNCSENGIATTNNDAMTPALIDAVSNDKDTCKGLINGDSQLDSEHENMDDVSFVHVQCRFYD